MGTFLASSLWVQVSIEKKDLIKESLDNNQLLDLLKTKIDFHPEIYLQSESDTATVFELDKNLISKELVPFLEQYYAIYHYREPSDGDRIVNVLKAMPSEQWESYIEDGNSDDIYAEDDYPRVQINNQAKINLQVHQWRLTFEGKVMAEAMGAHLKLFRYALRRAFDFKIAGALDVDIVG